MFTGLIEGMGVVVSAKKERGGVVLALDLGVLADGIFLGSSVAVSGACLSVTGLEGHVASFDLSEETLQKTKFGALSPGDFVNLERSLRADARLGGHFVTGHVDGVGKVVSVEEQEDFQVHTYHAPAEVAPLLISKGSVTVDGVSLTVAELISEKEFTVALIPDTLQRTTLGAVQPGDSLHLEGDMIGKYVFRYMESLNRKE